MRIIIIFILLLSVSITFLLTGCSAKQDAAIREKTNLGMGDLVKAKDKGIEGNLTASLAMDPVMKFYGVKASVSHDVVTLIGSVKTEEQKKQAEEIVRNTGLERIKTIINDIQVDPSLDEPPFDF